MVEHTTSTVHDDPIRGDNVLSVVAGELEQGWYEMRAGPLNRGLAWAPGAGLSYVRNDDGTTAVRFRIGSEPGIAYITVCETGGPGRKFYIQLTEQVRVRKPVADHVQIRTMRGPATCRSILDEDSNGTLDYDALNFVCEGVADDDQVRSG